MRRWTRAAVTVTVLAAATACSFTPLTNRVELGSDDFVVFVGEGVDGNTDLFVSLSSGGSVTQLTYTGSVEMLPRLSPDGGVLAFFRSRDTTAGSPRALIVMNLLSASERRLDLPDGSGIPTALGWNADGTAIYLRLSTGTWRVAAPPAPQEMIAVTASELVAADTALGTWLGAARFAEAVACPGGGVCVTGPRGDTTEIAPQGAGPLRWGADSIAWFEGDNLIVRGLGPGSARRVMWRRAPANPREASYAGR
ncbi:MAG: PD40 domain-containing protein [Gemmatimonadales bacterium]|nr:PD40 domain-containing protein [Gemmatimonadales bacterium]